MIYSTLADAKYYEAINPRIKQAIRFLQTTNLPGLKPGHYEIDGDNLFANVSCYNTKLPEQIVYEGHRKYIDLQYVYDGTEDVYCGFLPDFTMCKAFDTSADTALFNGIGFPLKLDSSRFVLFWPQDVHAPGFGVLQNQVRKVVIKIKL